MKNKYYIEDSGLVVIEPEDFKDFEIKLPEEDGEIKHYLGITDGLDLLEYLVMFKAINRDDISDFVKDNNIISDREQKLVMVINSMLDTIWEYYDSSESEQIQQNETISYVNELFKKEMLKPVVWYSEEEIKEYNKEKGDEGDASN